jgi:FkbM family methyltransferase
MARIIPQSVRARVYRLGPVSTAIRSLLTLTAPEGLTVVEVASGALQGKRFALDLKSEKDLYLGNYELDLLQAITRLAAPGAVVYDVGAHIGYHSIYFADRVGESGKVVAFEPHPENLDRLRQNLALNGLLERVEVIACAVGRESGQSEFLLHDSHAMGKLEGSLGRELKQGESLSIEAITLDHFVYQSSRREPDLIKLDIEGGEVQALEGMRNLIQRATPILLLELHGDQAARESAVLLEEMDYQLQPLAEGLTFSAPAHPTGVAYALATSSKANGDD